VEPQVCGPLGSDPPDRYPLIHAAVSVDHCAIDALAAGKLMLAVSASEVSREPSW